VARKVAGMTHRPFPSRMLRRRQDAVGRSETVGPMMASGHETQKV
jgi:hypothetical protein